MIQDISENFRDIVTESDTLIDHFVEHTRVRLLGCGTRRLTMGSVTHFLIPSFLIVYYQQGSVLLEYADRTVVLSPGSFYIFRPYELYSGVRTSDDPVCISYLQFDMMPFTERYQLGRLAMANTDALFQQNRYHLFGKMLQELTSEPPQKRGRTTMLRQLVKYIIAQILYDQDAQGDDIIGLLKQGREARLVNHAFDYTTAHLNEPIVIGNILKSGATSKTSLDRAFRHLLGLTPQRALLRFKIEHAIEMLLQDIPLREIVSALGFSSVYHFSNAFLSVTGQRPTAYREQHLHGSSV